MGGRSRTVRLAQGGQHAAKHLLHRRKISQPQRQQPRACACIVHMHIMVDGHGRL